MFTDQYNCVCVFINMMYIYAVESKSKKPITKNENTTPIMHNRLNFKNCTSTVHIKQKKKIYRQAKRTHRQKGKIDWQTDRQRDRQIHMIYYKPVHVVSGLLCYLFGLIHALTYNIDPTRRTHATE